MTEPQITIPLRHYDDLVAIAECYEGEGGRLHLNDAELLEVRGYLGEVKSVRAGQRDEEVSAISRYISGKKDSLEKTLSQAERIANSVNAFMIGHRLTADEVRLLIPDAYRLAQK